MFLPLFFNYFLLFLIVKALWIHFFPPFFWIRHLLLLRFCLSVLLAWPKRTKRSRLHFGRLQIRFPPLKSRITRASRSFSLQLEKKSEVKAYICCRNVSINGLGKVNHASLGCRIIVWFGLSLVKLQELNRILGKTYVKELASDSFPLMPIKLW